MRFPSRNVVGVAVAVLVAAAVVALARSGPVVVHEERTAFQLIRVVDDGDRRCLRFGEELQLNQSCRSLTHPERIELAYARVVLERIEALQPVPQRVLIIGLGGASLPNALVAAHPHIAIDAVELDPQVIAVAEKYFAFVQTPTVRAHAGDGASFIADAAHRDARYDLVIMDAFDDDGIPPALYSRALLENVRTLLGERGTFIANTIETSSGRELELTREVFGPQVEVTASGKNRILSTRR
ncbi:MAG: fused MFS/spermidine synthase [Archangium sp.]